MSLPTAVSLRALDSAFGSEPFVNVAAKSGIDTTTLDIAFRAEPFYSQGDASGAGGGAVASTTQFIIAT